MSQVRGAPAIAIVGSLSLAVELLSAKFDDKLVLRQEVEGKLNYLCSARPTAVNMKIAAEELTLEANLLCSDDSVSDAEQMKKQYVQFYLYFVNFFTTLPIFCLLIFTFRLCSKIVAMLEKDINDNTSIGEFGASSFLAGITGKVRVLTHCNTGSLATAGYGTALGVIRSLFRQGKLGVHWQLRVFFQLHCFMKKFSLICFFLLFRTCILYGNPSIQPRCPTHCL